MVCNIPMRNFKRNLQNEELVPHCPYQVWCSNTKFYATALNIWTSFSSDHKWNGILHSCFALCEFSLVQNSAPHDCTLTIIYAVLHLVWTDKLLVVLCLVRTKEVSIFGCTIVVFLVVFFYQNILLVLLYVLMELLFAVLEREWGRALQTCQQICEGR